MTDGAKLKEKLFNQKKNGWENLTESQRNEIFNYCNGYMGYLNKSKTEREIVRTSKEMAEKAGFKDINSLGKIKPGDKIYYINRDKNIYLAVIGTEPIEKGLHIKEVPIRYKKRGGGEAKLSSFDDGWRHVKYMLTRKFGKN